MSRLQKPTPAGKIWFGPLTGLIIGAITIWPVPYDRLSMGETVMTLGWVLLSAAAGAYLAKVTTRALPEIAFHVAGGVALADILRIIVECTIDPTAHNLWPFEIAWIVIVCWPSVMAGAATARFFERASRSDS